MSRAARIKETIRFTIIFVLVCYFGLIALVNLPAVQSRLSACASGELSSLLRTEASIGHVDLGFLNRIILHDVRIKDRQGGEMFRASRMSAKFELAPLLGGKISVSSVQLFGLDVRLKRPSPDAPLNCRFVIDAFAPKDTAKKGMHVDLRVNSVLVRRGQLSYDVASVPETAGRFNPSHIAVSNLSATLSLKALRADSLNLQLRRMSFNERSGLQLKRFQFKLTANRSGLYVNDMRLSLPHTDFTADTLSLAAPSLDSLPDFNKAVRYAGVFHAAVTPADLRAFSPALAHFRDSVSLRASFSGRGRRLRCDRLVLSGAQDEVSVRAEGMIDAAARPQAPRFRGTVAQASLSGKGLAWLAGNLKGNDSVPQFLERIGFLRFRGDVSGSRARLAAHGLIQTEPGDLRADITVSADSLSKSRSCSGRVTAEDFSLGKLLGKEDKIGKASFDLELHDFRYRNRKPESHIKGTVASLEYNNYTYGQISLDGNFKPGGFSGHLAVDDPNGSIEIDGSFATGRPRPDFNLKAKVRNFRPNKLRLTEKYADTGLSLNLTADFSGHSIDDMQGEIRLDSLAIDAPGDEPDYFMPYFGITADALSASGRKSVRIESPFLHGSVEGRYSYRTVLASVRKIILRYIPSLLTAEKKMPETDNNFRFSLRMENSDILPKAFGIPLCLQMPAAFSGHFNDSLGSISLNGYFPQFTYNGKRYESGTLLCKNIGDTLQCQLRASALMRKGAMFNFSLLARAKNDKMRTTLFWGNNTKQTFSGKLDALTSFSQSPDRKRFGARIDIRPSDIILNDTVWRVHPATVALAKDSIEIRNFLFEHADQHLSVSGRIGRNAADSCIADMKNISLRYVMDMIQFHAVGFDGRISGKARMARLLEDPVVEADIRASGFALNGSLLGEAEIKGAWDKEAEGIRLRADIRRDENCTTQVDGYISPKRKGLDLNIRAGGTPLAFLQPFVRKVFSDVSGEAYGNVRLFGPFSQLDLEGSVKARMGMKVNILNTRFEAKADSVRISPGLFRFSGVRVSDSEGHTGTADGTLAHTKMKDMRYSFSFGTRNMLVYNTSASTPEFPFYGQIYSTGNVRIQGGDNQLNVDGTVRADRGTSFSYVLGTAAEAASSGFITFADRTPRRQQVDADTEIYHYLNAQKEQEKDDGQADVHINLQIEPTNQASMTIVMDPSAGDNISAHGTGNLRINFFNKGDFQIFGTYNISDGLYKMSLQNVIRKDFILQPGGTVTFNGNPRNANLNVQAVYTVNSASLNDLIADASASKGNVRVNCLLNLSGNLTSPELKFGLELPTVSDEDQELVRSLTSTEEQMNTQIIYLLSVGKFYTYDIAAENASQTDATSSLAFSTLSGQLNNMLSQVINSRNWNVGTNLTTGEKGWSDVEAEAILSGRLLNNRLIINGNFGYRENTLQNTNFVGDFEAVWLLTPNGEFRLRGYNQTNDRYFTKSTLTTQGIGLMYKKDFTNWSELFDWFLRRRRTRLAKQNGQQEQQ